MWADGTVLRETTDILPSEATTSNWDSDKDEDSNGLGVSSADTLMVGVGKVIGTDEVGNFSATVNGDGTYLAAR